MICIFFLVCENFFGMENYDILDYVLVISGIYYDVIDVWLNKLDKFFLFIEVDEYI